MSFWKRKSKPNVPDDELTRAMVNRDKGLKEMKEGAAVLNETVRARHGIGDGKSSGMRDFQTLSDSVLNRSELGKAVLDALEKQRGLIRISLVEQFKIEKTLMDGHNSWAVWALAKWLTHLYPDFPDEDDRLKKAHPALQFARQAAEFRFLCFREELADTTVSRRIAELVAIQDSAEIRVQESLKAIVNGISGSKSKLALPPRFLKIAGDYELGAQVFMGIYVDFRGVARALFVYDTQDKSLCPHPDATLLLLAGSFARVEVEAAHTGVKIHALDVEFVGDQNILSRYKDSLGFLGGEDSDCFYRPFGSLMNTKKGFRKTLIRLLDEMSKLTQTTEFSGLHDGDAHLDNTDADMERHFDFIEKQDELYILTNKVISLSKALSAALKQMRVDFVSHGPLAQPPHDDDTELSVPTRVRQCHHLSLAQVQLEFATIGMRQINQFAEEADLLFAEIQKLDRAPRFDGQVALMGKATADNRAIAQRMTDAAPVLLEIERIVNAAELLAKASVEAIVNKINGSVRRHTNLKTEMEILLREAEASDDIELKRRRQECAHQFTENILKDFWSAVDDFRKLLSTFGLDGKHFQQQHSSFVQRIIPGIDYLQKMTRVALFITRQLDQMIGAPPMGEEGEKIDAIVIADMQPNSLPDIPTQPVEGDVRALIFAIKGKPAPPKSEKAQKEHSPILSNRDAKLLAEIQGEDGAPPKTVSDGKGVPPRASSPTRQVLPDERKRSRPPLTATDRSLDVSLSTRPSWTGSVKDRSDDDLLAEIMEEQERARPRAREDESKTTVLFSQLQREMEVIREPFLQHQKSAIRALNKSELAIGQDARSNYDEQMLIAATEVAGMKDQLGLGAQLLKKAQAERQRLADEYELLEMELDDLKAELMNEEDEKSRRPKGMLDKEVAFRGTAVDLKRADSGMRSLLAPFKGLKEKYDLREKAYYSVMGKANAKWN